MQKAEEIVVEAPRLAVPQFKKSKAPRTELTLRKLTLSALTILGVGYVMVNIPIMILLGYFWSIIPISSQANIAAISGRILFIMASAVSSILGLVFVLSGVKLYEGSPTKRIVFLGLLLGSFYLLCLGIGSTLMLQGEKPASLLLLAGPILAIISAATYMVPSRRFKLGGSALGVVSGGMVAYALFDVRIFELVFNWGIPMNGPFMSLLAVEIVVFVLGPVAALVSSILGAQKEEKPLKHLFILLLGLVYGVGVFVGSLVLSMSLWDIIWKSPWVGPLNGLPSWIMNTIVFWSASLFLPIMGGILLIIASCLGFALVTREFSQF